MNTCNDPCGYDHGAGVRPGPYISPNCGKPKKDLRIKTELLPASVGTDEKGQPYAPKLRSYFNTVVQYAANDAVYIYDSQGIYTKMNSTTTVDNAIAILKQQISALQDKEQSDVDNLQENINQLANKEAEDVENLQTNINTEVNRALAAEHTLSQGLNDENSRAYNAEQALETKIDNGLETKQDTLVSGTNIKTINGESVLGEGNLVIAGGEGGSDARLQQYVLTGATAEQLLRAVGSEGGVVLRGTYSTTNEGDWVNGPLTTIAPATSTVAGVMSPADKAKLDSLSGGGSAPENLNWVFGGNNDTPKQVTIIDATFNTQPSLGLSIPYFDYSDNEVKLGNTDVFPFATTDRAGLMSATDKTKLDSLSASTNLTSVPTASYTADNVNLTFGDENVELTPAVGTTSGSTVSKAGIMSAFQASQLEALAAAYEAEEKGTILYEGSASVNNIELSESGLSYDHLIVVAQYMGMGSFALEQQVSEVFYPTDSVKSFQMNATDITTGNTPMVQLIQDIWSITDDGMELELASALKATVNSETTVTPDTTSHFTITKVVGFGKKLAES